MWKESFEQFFFCYADLFSASDFALCRFTLPLKLLEKENIWFKKKKKVASARDITGQYLARYFPPRCCNMPPGFSLSTAIRAAVPSCQPRPAHAYITLNQGILFLPIFFVFYSSTRFGTFEPSINFGPHLAEKFCLRARFTRCKWACGKRLESDLKFLKCAICGGRPGRNSAQLRACQNFLVHRLSIPPCWVLQAPFFFFLHCCK